jgi:hypothetical protein
MSEKPLAEGPEDCTQTEGLGLCPHCEIVAILEETLEQHNPVYTAAMLARVVAEFFSSADPIVMRQVYAEFLVNTIMETSHLAEEAQVVAMCEAMQSVQITLRHEGTSVH